jgi:hypothetical protein
MGKQSRRTRQHTAPVKRQTAPVKQQTAPVKQSPMDFKLDRNDAEDMKILQMIKTSEKYKPLIHEDIREPPTGPISITNFYKFGLRRSRQRQAIYIHELTTELVNAYALMKNGTIQVKPLYPYFNDLTVKTSLINFLTHLHNGNEDKASHYYLKWRGVMSSMIDDLLFEDCSDQYIEINGKKIGAGKDEAVRLIGEKVQADVDLYKKVWGVLIGTEFPVC